MMMRCLLVLTLVVAVSAFRPTIAGSSSVRRVNGARSMTAIFDGLGALALAAQLNNNSPRINRASMPIAVVETKQGMYKEYTVDKEDDSKLDEIRRGYKTAEETDDSKNKYWAILGVLVAGSFVIPMVQYYWYVAEED